MRKNDEQLDEEEFTNRFFDNNLEVMEDYSLIQQIKKLLIFRIIYAVAFSILITIVSINVLNILILLINNLILESTVLALIFLIINDWIFILLAVTGLFIWIWNQ